jgi:hypothetical protein
MTKRNKTRWIAFIAAGAAGLVICAAVALSGARAATERGDLADTASSAEPTTPSSVEGSERPLDDAFQQAMEVDSKKAQ